MVQVGDKVQPHNKNPVGDSIELENLKRPHHNGEPSKEASHGKPARCGRQHILLLVGLEQIAARVEMRARLPWTPRPQVEGVREHRER